MKGREGRREEEGERMRERRKEGGKHRRRKEGRKENYHLRKVTAQA